MWVIKTGIKGQFFYVIIILGGIMYKYLDNFIKYLKYQKYYSEHTIINYEHDIKEFLMFLEREGFSDLKDVEYDIIRTYLMELHEKRYNRQTVSRRLSSLRSFYNFLVRENIVSKNPFLLVSSPKKELNLPKFLYKEELEKLFQAAEDDTPLGKRNLLILEMLYATGVRVSELCNIKLSHIDFDNYNIIISGKGNKDRFVSYGAYCADALVDYLENARGKLINNKNHDYLFVNHLGGPLTPRGVRVILDKLIKKACLNSYLTPHVLRHTFATDMLNAGADLRVVQELLGHENLATTQIYTHVTRDHLKNIYTKAHPRAKKTKNNLS